MARGVVKATPLATPATPEAFETTPLKNPSETPLATLHPGHPGHPSLASCKMNIRGKMRKMQQIVGSCLMLVHRRSRLVVPLVHATHCLLHSLSQPERENKKGWNKLLESKKGLHSEKHQLQTSITSKQLKLEQPDWSCMKDF